MILGWQTWRRHYSRLSSSSLLRNHDRRHSEEARATYWNIVLPVLTKEKGTKSTNQLERQFTSEDWSLCLSRRSFKSVNWAIFVQSEDHKRIVPPRMMNYAKILYKSTIHQYRGLSRRSFILLQKLDWELYGWCSHSYRRKTHISSTMVGVQFVSTTMPAKQK